MVWTPLVLGTLTPIIVISLIITSRNHQIRYFLQRKKYHKGAKKMMPTELIQEFIGKNANITVMGEFPFVGKIICVEEGWIKVEEKRSIRLINVDMISSISLDKEK